MLIVGLGNPGSEYAANHHNIGFMMVDSVADKYNVKFKNEKKFQAEVAEFRYNNEKHYIIKPQTYMNLSGKSVKAFVDYYKISLDDIIVIYDDLDIPLGDIRIRKNGSSGGHNGMKSIISNLNSEEFKRIRIGIGRNSDNNVIDYVLSDFTNAEKQIIEPVINMAPAIITDLLDRDIDYIMNKYN